MYSLFHTIQCIEKSHCPAGSPSIDLRMSCTTPSWDSVSDLISMSPFTIKEFYPTFVGSLLLPYFTHWTQLLQSQECIVLQLGHHPHKLSFAKFWEERVGRTFWTCWQNTLHVDFCVPLSIARIRLLFATLRAVDPRDLVARKFSTKTAQKIETTLWSHKKICIV